jgi:multiple sugar transport system permease protein
MTLTPTRRIALLWRRSSPGYLLALSAFTVFLLFPIFWIALSAFKRPIDVRRPTILFEPTLDNFRIIFSDLYRFGDLLVNSLIVCTAVVVISVPLAAMAAYGLARFRIRGKRWLLVAILSAQFFPAVVLVLPYFALFRQLGILDTLTALVIISLTHTLPFTIWLMKGFVETLPVEIEESAMVDGCSEIGVLRHIVLPLALPGLLTSAIFAFILSWNELIYALILTSKASRTVTVGLVSVVGERDVPWEQMSAAGILVMVPVLIMSFAIRRYFVSGLTAGAVK